MVVMDVLSVNHTLMWSKERDSYQLFKVVERKVATISVL